MITIDSDPMLNPIYLGASILNEFHCSSYTEIKIESLYMIIKDKFDTSYEVFAVALDWLFVIGIIDINENGLLEYAVK